MRRAPENRTAVVVVRSEPLERRRLLDGLTGQYFNRVDHTELVATRLDPTLDFTWDGSPAGGVNVDKFSVRWTGQVQAPTSENYTFTTTADDGVRLWVDGRLLIDNWTNQAPTDRTGTVSLEAGKRYDICIDYYEFDFGARFRLQWQSANTPKQTVPAVNLFPSPAGLSATYFDNADFSKPLLERNDANVDFDWPSGSPDAAVPGDGLAVRWTGYVVPQYSQTYTFRVTPSAGSAPSAVRLAVDGKTLVDNASIQDDGRIRLEAGARYTLSLEYADPSGPAGVKLEWSSPSQPLQTVPASRLFAGSLTQVPLRRVTYSNPTLDADTPDPGIIFADGAYWMIHTTGGPDYGWPLSRSTDGVNYTFVKQLLTPSNKPSWMSGEFWAPEIHKFGNRFILVSTARDSRTGRLSIVMAVSSTIDGTYTVRSEPIVSDDRHVLDPNFFVDDDGTPYLLWKRDGPFNGTHGTIRIQRLDESGLNFAAGSTQTVLLDNETAGWEAYLAEAPWLVKRADAYYLFYSGAFIDTSYKVGVARGTSLTSMFTRNPGNPIIGNNSTWSGPGHGGFAMDADGTLWHLYHARRTSDPNAGRKQVLDPVVWTLGLWPRFTNDGVSSTPQPGPDVQALSGAGILTLSGDAAGTAADDMFRLVRSGVGYAMLDLYVNGTLSRSVPFAQVQSITIDGKAGDDTLLLDDTYGDVIPGGGLTFLGGAGTNDTVRLTAQPGIDDHYRHLGNGQIAYGSGLLSSSSVERLGLAGGDHRVVGLAASNLNVELSTAASMTFAVNQTLASLTIGSSAMAALAPGNRTIVVNALSVTGGKLDVADGAVVVNYADGAASPLDTIEGNIRSARSLFNAVGIFSSVATAAGNGATVGAGPMSDAFTTSTATFAGVSVDASSVLIRHTLEGDANLDRTVDFGDLLTLARNYNQSGKSFTGGNFNYSPDGAVTFDDLLRLAKSYARSLTLAAAQSDPLMASVTTTRSRRSVASDVL